MRIEQLRDYLTELIAAGVDPNMPVCIHEDEHPVTCVTEVDDAAILFGPFREDPSPKACGFLRTRGKFLLLKSAGNLDYEPLFDQESTPYTPVDVPVSVPMKTWPNGHWFGGQKRSKGQL